MSDIKSNPSIKRVKIRATNFHVVVLREDFDRQGYGKQEAQDLVDRMQSACKLPVFIR